MKKNLLIFALLMVVAMPSAWAVSIWGATDRSPATATMRFPVDTSSSSGPGYLDMLDVSTYVNANLDADLLAIAGLTSAADKGIQFTGAGTAGTFDLTAAGKAILDDADAAAQRTTLGLVIGTNVQAYDADLAALAGLTSAANTCFYFSGSGTAATFTCSAGGRALTNAGGTADTIPYFSASNTVSLLTTTTGGRALLNNSGTANTYPYYSASNTVSLQAVSAGGRALGNTTGATDTIPYYSGASTATTTSFTSTARSILDDTSIGAVRTTLGLRQEYCVALSDQTTDLATGTAAATMYLPAAATLNAVRAYVNTVPTGSTIIVDINEAGTTVLSTKLSIDASEGTSGTAASAAVISDSSIAANAVITFDIDQVGSTIKGKGLVACIDVSF